MSDLKQVETRKRRSRVGRETCHPIGRGRPVGNHEERKKKLLKAVIETIAQEGSATVSIRKVAKTARCSAGAVTHYFSSKDEMIVAATHSLFDELDTLLDYRHGNIDIEKLARDWVGWGSSRDIDLFLVIFQLVVYAVNEPMTASTVRDRYARFRAMLTEILGEGQRIGVVRDDVCPEDLADILSVVGDGWAISRPMGEWKMDSGKLQKMMEAVAIMMYPTV